MSDSIFVGAAEVAEILDISKALRSGSCQS